MSATGTLRLSRVAALPWIYAGELWLPSGRHASLRARVAEDAKGKFFELEACLEPGMTAAELEAVLVECERVAADRIARERSGIADIPIDELPF